MKIEKVEQKYHDDGEQDYYLDDVAEKLNEIIDLLNVGLVDSLNKKTEKKCSNCNQFEKEYNKLLWVQTKRRISLQKKK